MTFSTSCLSKRAALLVLVALYLTGCAHVDGTGGPPPPPVAGLRQVAVLPLENVSGKTVPLKELRQSLIDVLKQRGVGVLDEATLERFMTKYRLRYTGGINLEAAQALKAEAGADAVLITFVELYYDSAPPKISIVSRLVSTGDLPVILWTDSVGLSGDASPGLLGLGLIGDHRRLREKAFRTLTASLLDHLTAHEEAPPSDIPGIPETPAAPARPASGTVRTSPVTDLSIDEDAEYVYKGRRFKPKISFRTPFISPGRKYTVAVAPFLNSSKKKHAGEIISQYFVKHMVRKDAFDVIEPGVVRQQLLAMRIIMQDGISVADADLVTNALRIDYLVTGRVVEYQDVEGPEGRPLVNFSVMVYERGSRRVVWSSNSYNYGDDGVFFFNAGRIYTAGTLASEMVRVAVELMGR